MKFVYTPTQFCEYVIRTHSEPGIPLTIDRRQLPLSMSEPSWVYSKCRERNLEKTVEIE